MFHCRHFFNHFFFFDYDNNKNLLVQLSGIKYSYQILTINTQLYFPITIPV